MNQNKLIAEIRDGNGAGHDDDGNVIVSLEFNMNE